MRWPYLRLCRVVVLAYFSRGLFLALQALGFTSLIAPHFYAYWVGCVKELIAVEKAITAKKSRRF